MQNLLDCSIAKDALEYVNIKNKVLVESIRYRFIYENSTSLTDNTEIYNLSTWYKWYTAYYCKQDPICLPTTLIFCNLYISEIDAALCTETITIEEI